MWKCIKYRWYLLKYTIQRNEFSLRFRFLNSVHKSVKLQSSDQISETLVWKYTERFQILYLRLFRTIFYSLGSFSDHAYFFGILLFLLFLLRIFDTKFWIQFFIRSMLFDRNEILVYWGNHAVVSIEIIHAYDGSKVIKRFNIYPKSNKIRFMHKSKKKSRKIHNSSLHICWSDLIFIDFIFTQIIEKWNCLVIAAAISITC